MSRSAAPPGGRPGRTVYLSAAIALACGLAGPAAATEVLSTYVGPAAGEWKDAAAWSNDDGSVRFPDSFADLFAAVVTPTTPTTVTLLGSRPGAAAIGLSDLGGGTTPALRVGPSATVVVDTQANLRDSSLQITGDVVNDGTIVLRDLDPGAGSRNLALLRFSGLDRRLAGSGRVLFDTPHQNTIDAIVTTSGPAAASIVIGADQTISTSAGAAGTLSVTFANEGTIDADDGSIVLGQGNQGANSNRGRIASRNGGTVEVAFALDNAGGTIEIDGASEVHQRARISGGTIQGPGTLRATSNSAAVLEGVTLDQSTALVETPAGGGPSRAFSLQGTIRNDGVLRLDDMGAGGAQASLVVDGAVTIDGTGELIFASANENRIRCNGTPCTSAAFGTLVLGPGQTTRVAAGHRGSLDAITENRGTMHIDGTLEQTLIGTPSEARFVSSGVLRGDGLVDVAGQFGFRNDGTVAPGDGTGRLTFRSGYAQSGTGRLAIELGGPVFDVAGLVFEHDRLAVEGGPARLDGLLDVSLVGGFLPEATDEFTVVTATGGVIGRFANTPGDVLTFSGGTFDVLYGPDFVRLSNFLAATSVPEPATVVLLAGAWLVLGRRRRPAARPGSPAGG